MILIGYVKSDFSVCLPVIILRDKLVGDGVEKRVNPSIG